jgi:multiple sugar transport system ATP-binding protein
MAFGLKLRKVSKQEVKERVGEAADILGLSGLLDRYPKQLSGGQRQRVALGRAIVRRPAVFLMDEPLSNLDAKLRVQMRSELQRIHKTLKATVIYVTHDQVEAMTLGQRISVILNGELQQVDNPLTVYSNPSNRFVGGFIGSPPMNFIDGTVIKKDNKYTFECEGFRMAIPDSVAHLLENYIGKKVVFGIRPEDVWDVPSSEWIKEKLYLDSLVDFREIIGAETYLYIHVGSIPLVSRVNGLCDASTGSEFKVVVNLNKIHFFDPETQKAII